MVKRVKMEKFLSLAVLVMTLMSPSLAQNVMAVDHYISDTAPVAGIGVGESVRGVRPAVPQFPEPPLSSYNSRGSDTRHSEPIPLPRDVDRTVTYVEDVLAGRRDVSEGVEDAVFEPQERRTSPVSSGGGYSSAGRTRDEESRDRPAAVTSHSARDPGGTVRRPTDDGPRTVVSGSPREASRSSGVDTGYSRDDIRPVTPSRVAPADTGSHRRPQYEEGVSFGVGNNRDSDRPHSAMNPPPRRTDTRSDVISTPGRQRDELPDTRYDGGSSSIPSRGSSVPARGSSVPVHGSSVPSRGSSVPDRGSSVPDRGSSVPSRGSSVPERDYTGSSSASSSNKRGYSTDDEELPYRRKEASTISSDPSRDAYSGNSREESRDPISLSSHEPEVTPYRDTVPERNRDTMANRFSDDGYDNSRVAASHNSRDHVTADNRGTSSGFSSGTGDVRSPTHDNSHHTNSGHADDELREHLRETMIPNSRDTLTGGNRESVVHHPMTSTVDHHRDTNIGNSRGTDVSRPRDTVVEDSQQTPADRRPNPVDDYSQPSYVDNSRDSVSHKSTNPEYHRESVAGNSRDSYGTDENKSDQDSDFARPMEFPRGESVEDPIYSSRSPEDLEASFGFDSAEEDEDIAGAHSSRPLPKTQKPRQVTATQERRGPRGPHPASPCPSVFSYEGTRAGKERWYGVVLITTTETLTGLRLEITLDKKADLLGTWLGEVSSLDNIHYTIWNGRRKVNPGPPLSVKIFVKYSDQEYEPPRIKTIRLNGRQICPKDKASPMPAPPRPPPRPNLPGKRPSQGTKPTTRPSGQKPRPQATTRPQNKPSQKPSTSNAGAELVDGVACGRIDVQPTPLITYGQRTSRGQWPWHAAIYQSKGTDLSYICGGSLIGKRTVLTAAHCVSRRYIDRPVDPETLVVYLGKYHLKLWSEGGVQDKQVADIHVHPEYNSTDFRADIAVLILSSPVEFSVYVKPVCLWDKSKPELNEVEGKEGVVVGWGYDETGTVTEDLMMAKMPVVSQQTCIWSYPQFFSHFTSDRTYCAGFRNGTSVCNGDSGGGMVFPKSTGIGQHGAVVTWALRGIVSLSTSQANKRICNTEHYVVFTDVVKFYPWLNKYM
ncbi:uncharacterized protein LOC124155875 isoform X2 [Ischnura elegans]|uniref:uncharacterized protein LOC124155875 isoform X2 n=1 Tax=Ischnura elegans TaxID=197161 RepID=UPI001ED8728F|nr:uncharacterized protein LOC124155875 isoform X2 [Ischnura elegans]